MSSQRPLTDQEYELLSAYLDGALSDSERLTLEQQLQTDAALRRELNALRQAVALIQNLPTLTAPRSFTLSANMVAPRPRQTIAFPAVFSAVSAAAAIILIFFGGLLLTRGTPAAAPLASNSAGAIAQVPTATSAAIGNLIASKTSEAETSQAARNDLAFSETETASVNQPDSSAEIQLFAVTETEPSRVARTATLPPPQPTMPASFETQMALPSGGASDSAGGSSGGFGGGAADTGLAQIPQPSEAGRQDAILEITVTALAQMQMAQESAAAEMPSPNSAAQSFGAQGTAPQNPAQQAGPVGAAPPSQGGFAPSAPVSPMLANGAVAAASETPTDTPTPTATPTSTPTMTRTPTPQPTASPTVQPTPVVSPVNDSSRAAGLTLLFGGLLLLVAAAINALLRRRKP